MLLSLSTFVTGVPVYWVPPRLSGLEFWVPCGTSSDIGGTVLSKDVFGSVANRIALCCVGRFRGRGVLGSETQITLSWLFGSGQTLECLLQRRRRLVWRAGLSTCEAVSPAFTKFQGLVLFAA